MEGGPVQLRLRSGGDEPERKRSRASRVTLGRPKLFDSREALRYTLSETSGEETSLDRAIPSRGTKGANQASARESRGNPKRKRSKADGLTPNQAKLRIGKTKPG